ncbi:MAG: hypothetical protein SF162_11185 [bacterium]|nr:hypothetical protein [bacterium]
MSIEGLILGAILVTLTLLIIAAPLIARPEQRSTEDILIEKQRERLTVYYERALRNIRDLDEDHALGKIDPADYAADRELWMQRGVQALKALDELAARRLIAMQGDDNASVDQAIHEAIEAAVQKARSTVSV